MDRINRYFLSHFFSMFGSLFATLFFIMSIVFFIQIARVTSVIEITFFELGKLYLFMLPQILLFTIPISFFISLGLTLFKLSRENETIVLFTLGYSPKKIARFFFLLATLTSLLLLVNALVLLPIAGQLNKNFIDYKRTNAKLTLKAAEFGQRFSDWLVFIEGKHEKDGGDEYEQVVMYATKSEQNNERLLLAEEGRIANAQGELTLSLEKGRGYEFSPSRMHELIFDEMFIQTYGSGSLAEVVSLAQYWKEARTNKRRAEGLSLDVLVALFPMASALFALSFGIVTYRYQKRGIYGATFLVLFAYFALIMLVNKALPLLSIPLIFGLFLVASWFYFQRKIVRRY
ncbi:MAG: LptF/LptG family permease [Campylobacterales bacterium]|nr:LptF/LptG family permease [Campylobacterales bacterium]